MTKKSGAKYRRSYATTRFRRRFKYVYGQYNFMRLKFEVTGLVQFPTETGQPNIMLGTGSSAVNFNAASLGRILSLCPAYSEYGSMFAERKIRGIKYEFTPIAGTISSPNTICATWGPFGSANWNFNSVSGANGSVVLDANGKVSKYIPLHNEWTMLREEDWGKEGGFGLAALYTMARTSYNKSYTIKITMYVTLKGVKI